MLIPHIGYSVRLSLFILVSHTFS